MPGEATKRHPIIIFILIDKVNIFIYYRKLAFLSVIASSAGPAPGK
jgi:hypothetical protein